MTAHRAHPVRRRGAALIALLAAGLALLTAVTFPFIHFPSGIFAFVLAVIAVPLVWSAVTRSGATRWLAAATAVLALGGAIAILVRDHAVLDLIAFIAFAAIAAAAARVAVISDRHAVEAARPALTDAGKASRGVLLMNPWSGGGKVAKFDLPAEARARGIEPIVLEKGQDLTELATAALDGGADVIGMAGGDGSQALVAALAAERGIPYVCVPAGTRNHLALDLGVDRNDVVGALDAYVAGRERTVDLATVNGRVFVNNVSLGVYAKIVQSDEYRDAKIETAARLLPEMLGPEAQPFDLQFAGPQGKAHDGAIVILVSNNPYRFAPGGFGTRPSMSGGVLGIVAAAEIAPGETETRGPGARPIPGPFGWLEWSAPTFEVASSSPVEAGIDGEALVLDAPLRFETRPHALRVRIAPGHLGISPAAITEAMSARSLARIAFGREAPPASDPVPAGPRR